MKKIAAVYLLLALLFPLASRAELDFTFGEIDKALAKAKTEKKHVLLYFHTSQCTPCVKLEKSTFSDSLVRRVFEEDFITVDIGPQEKNTKEISNQYRVSSYPTLIYLDEKGTFLEKTVGFLEPEALIDILKSVKNNFSQYNQMEEKYQTYSTDPDFRISYCWHKARMSEADSTLIRSTMELIPPGRYGEDSIYSFLTAFLVYQLQVLVPETHPIIRYIQGHVDQNDPKTIGRLGIYYALCADKIETLEEEERLVSLASMMEKLDQLIPSYPIFIYRYNDTPYGLLTRKHSKELSLITYYRKLGQTEKYQQNILALHALIWDDKEELEEQLDYLEQMENKTTWEQNEIDKLRKHLTDL